MWWWHLYQHLDHTEVNTTSVVSMTYPCWTPQSPPLLHLRNLRSKYLPLPACTSCAISACDWAIIIILFIRSSLEAPVCPYSISGVSGSTFLFAFHQSLPCWFIEHAPFLALCKHLKNYKGKLPRTPRVLALWQIRTWVFNFDNQGYEFWSCDK